MRSAYLKRSLSLLAIYLLSACAPGENSTGAAGTTGSAGTTGAAGARLQIRKERSETLDPCRLEKRFL
jgi:hypothetical protein